MTIAGPNAHNYVMGKGAETKLYVFDHTYTDAVATNRGNILQYNIGEKTLPWEEAPSAIVYNDIANGNLQQNYSSMIAPDGRGGWWLSQYRATDAANIPCLVHINTEGLVDFNSGENPTLIGESRSGAMAVTADYKRIAMGGNNVIRIYDITFDASNVPSLTLAHTVTPAVGANSQSAAFDVAGNVYLVSNSNERLAMWALPKADNSFTTPAREEFKFSVEFPKVEDLTAAAEKNVVTLTWKNPSLDASANHKYNIYRDDALLETIQGATSVTYKDYYLAKGTYKYDVTIVSGDDESDKVTASVTVTEDGAPVSNLQANVLEKDVTLTWNVPANPVVEGITYNIYKQGTLLTNVSVLTYTDANLEAGTYNYEISVVYDGTESAKVAVQAVITTTGISSSDADTFKVYPNPTDGELRIETGGELINTVRLYDMGGKLMISTDKVANSEYTLDLTTYPQGNYILKVNDKTIKVVKK